MTDEPAIHPDEKEPLRDADNSKDDVKEFEQRLEAIEAKAKSARKEHSEVLEQTEHEKQLSSESASGLGFGLAIAYTIIGVPLFAVAIGWFIDRATNSNVFLSLFALIGSVAGIVVAVYLVNRQNAGK